MTTSDLAIKCLRTLNRDMPQLERIDNYSRGYHEEPYLPESADAEYRQLARRSITNLTEFIVGTSAQAMYVDGFRRSASKTAGASGSGVEPEWVHWQESRLDARQSAVYRGALTFGHSFVVTEQVKGKVVSRGLSALRTVALYDDPSSDDAPLFALHVKSFASPDRQERGKAVAWDETYIYDVTFDSLGGDKVTVQRRGKHGANECPVTRFTATVDLEGRTVGVVEPLIPLQDRLNQTIFDLLVTQSFSSFKVRTVTGMAPPMKMNPVYERPNGTPTNPNDKGAVVGAEPAIDPETGRPMPENVKINQRRLLFAEDPDSKFGTLDETPLDGFIASIEMSFRHIAALSQTPPHHLLGQIANLSAEALQAAETALQRKVSEFQAGFGESWERVFRIAASMAGDRSLENDYSGEVLWRDMEQRSMAQAGDALSKLANDLKIPVRGLWPRVPGVTSSEIANWEALADEEDKDAQLAAALDRAAGTRPPSFRQSQEVTDGVTAEPVIGS